MNVVSSHTKVFCTISPGHADGELTYKGVQHYLPGNANQGKGTILTQLRERLKLSR